jgi:alkyldihydroxyacetonephosphate synthase
MQKVCGSGLISCRMTHVYPDGAAPYYTFIAPAAPGEQLRAWQALKDAASEIVVEAGGTITHHHAVGREHRPQWKKQRPQLFGEALHAVKTTLDPDGMMNPGVF